MEAIISKQLKILNFTQIHRQRPERITVSITSARKNKHTPPHINLNRTSNKRVQFTIKERFQCELTNIREIVAPRIILRKQMSLHLLLILIKCLIIKAAYRYHLVQELDRNSNLNLRRTNMINKILEGEAKFKWR